MWILFYSLIIAASFMVVPSAYDPFWRTKEIIYLLFCLLIIGASWMSKYRFTRGFTDKFYAGFFIWIFLLFFWIFLIPIGLAKTEYSVWYVWTLLPTLNCLLGLVMVRELVINTDTTIRWLTAVKVFCGVGTCVAVYAICQNFGADQLFSHLSTKEIVQNQDVQVYEMFTFMGNKMITNNFIAIICPLFLIFNKARYYLGLAVCLIALLLFRSAFNIISAGVGMVFILIIQGRWRAVVAVIAAGILYVTVLKPFTNLDGLAASGFNGRWPYWVEVITKIKHRIFTGYGLGSIARTYANQYVTFKRWTSSHNFALDMLYETGLIGVGLIGGYLLNLGRRVKNVFMAGQHTLLFAGLIGSGITWLLISNSSFLHMVAPTAILGLLIVGGIETHLNERRVNGV